MAEVEDPIIVDKGHVPARWTRRQPTEYGQYWFHPDKKTMENFARLGKPGFALVDPAQMQPVVVMVARRTVGTTKQYVVSFSIGTFAVDFMAGWWSELPLVPPEAMKKGFMS